MTDSPMKFTALVGDGKRSTDLTAEMADRIKDVIGEYSGKMPLASAIGVLHIVAKEMMDNH